MMFSQRPQKHLKLKKLCLLFIVVRDTMEKYEVFQEKDLGRLVKRFRLWSSNFGESLQKQWFSINWVLLESVGNSITEYVK